MKRLILIAVLMINLALTSQVYAIPSNFVKIDTITYGEDMIHTYLHKQTDMTVKWVQNNDPKASFTLGVRTPTEDSSGVNHIIEHTVFTGSNKFPSSTLFFDANANYPHTYMNASTAADFTMYPFSTPYKECYEGLLEVYLDSVLNPNMLKQPHSFYEESFYYDPDTNKYGGVVYNEMKGANSQIGRVIFRNIRSSIYKDTHYENDSGGEVSEIPTLTYKKFVDTYNKYYYPQNMMIVLYGDQNINNTLEIIGTYLDEYVETKNYNNTKEPINVNVVPTLDATRIDRTYNTGGEGSYVIKSFVLPNEVDVLKMLEIDLWINTYMMDQNSAFRQNLFAAGIDSIEIFKDSELYQPVYSIIISQIAQEDVEHTKQILENELEKVWQISENSQLEQDTLQENKLGVEKEDLSSDRGLEISHSIISNWVRDRDELSYYKMKDYLLDISDIDENIGKDLLKTSTQVDLIITPSTEVEPQANPLELSEIDETRWSDIVASMRTWQKAYSGKVLDPTKLNKMLMGTDMSSKSYKKNGIKYTRYHSNTALLSSEIYMETSHIVQKELPYLFLYSYCLQQAAQELTPFEGVLKSRIVALENDQGYTPYLKIEMLTTKDKNQQLLLDAAIDSLKNKDSEWYELQLEKIIGEFYGNFQNDIIGTLGSLTNGGQSGYKRYIYEAHYPFYQFVIECKTGVQKDYIAQILAMIDKVRPSDGTSIAVIGDKKDAKQELEHWQQYCDEHKIDNTEKIDYKFETIQKDSVYYKKGQVDYLLYNYDTQKDYVEAIDYLVAAYATKNYLQPEIRIKKGAYGSGMQVRFPNTISIYTYRDPHYKSSIEVIEEMATTLDMTDIDEKLRMAKSEALCDFQTQFGLLGSDMKKASILHAIDLMDVSEKYIKSTQKEIIKITAEELIEEMGHVDTIVNDSKKGVCIKKN
ncbi:MAG: hypothetical protein ATN35_09195 [Epulopiscium sp. Nele67-Bin004]|nr:MAG: hypothetical protein ATN35_09195 [Epulopiscium sp. Nele67-Bin004]